MNAWFFFILLCTSLDKYLVTCSEMRYHIHYIYMSCTQKMESELSDQERSFYKESDSKTPCQDMGFTYPKEKNVFIYEIFRPQNL